MMSKELLVCILIILCGFALVITMVEAFYGGNNKEIKVNSVAGVDSLAVNDCQTHLTMSVQAPSIHNDVYFNVYRTVCRISETGYTVQYVAISGNHEVEVTE